jgi:hypothetical protein
MVKKAIVMMFVGTVLIMVTGSYADIPTLSIYQIQYTTNADGTSNYNGQRVNCIGGIVINRYLGTTQRLVLYDPNNADGWGGILAKSSLAQFTGVNVGDWASIENVLVDESSKARGNTILFLDASSTVTVHSSSLPLPEPIVVDVNYISVVYDPIYETCYVTDHRAEKYEAMYLQVRNVAVGDMNVGKAGDNYSLVSIEDPNIYCWASDYMNADLVPPALYLPKVVPGQSFCSVSGIIEQYTKLSDDWDYYQLLTTDDDALAITQTGDLDEDCDVDFEDLAILSRYWLVGTK